MGLYDEDYAPEMDEMVKDIKPQKSKKKIKLKIDKNFNKYLYYALFILLAVVIIYGIYVFFQPKPVSVNFESNPLILSEGNSTKFVLRIYNPYSDPWKSIKIFVEPYDKTAIAIVPSEPIEVKVLGPKESREFSYEISKIGKEIPGDYSFKVKVQSSQHKIEENYTLTIKKE